MNGEVSGPTVVVLTGPRPGDALRLEDRAVELGRGAGSDLVIDQADVARRHARLEPREGSWVIIDLSAGGGLRVNGSDVREHRLESGDRIQLGEAIVVFADPQRDQVAWLTTPTSVERHDESMSSGALRRQWHELRAFMKPGDALWCFDSGADSWRRLSGRAGLCVVREGAVVYTLVTEMN